MERLPNKGYQSRQQVAIPEINARVIEHRYIL
ncbi:MAG: hypothetical protein HQK96_02970 [Nitrospirae bacterium]|nr:hypothetical protein [Nitrospirota bacterium]